MATIFTKLIKGELPSYKLYQDKDVFSFLDINPITIGHTLVISTQEIDHFTDVPSKIYLKVMEQAQVISKAIHKAVGSKRVAMIIQGFEVPHFHVHLIPVNRPGELSFARAQKRTDKEMQEIHQKILDVLATE